MPIPESILERVETFRRNLDSYLRPDYKEAQVRQEFIDPLFEALGWNLRNTRGHAEQYKDVVHEDSLRISGVNTSAPDYSFRIGGTRKFFVEAKRPAIVLKDNPEPAAQLRRYSWSAKLALGIVTDFQEFAVYDTRIRPREGDKASVARIFYYTYEEFPEKWDEIAGIFAKESVLQGSFDRFAVSTKGKRGTAEFDAAFLEDMEAWRKRLAENLALRNRALTERDLNFAVQRTLDRIIFLRIAEDRRIEPYGRLQGLTNGGNIYPRLCEIFGWADNRYNSGLFHFADEKGRDESPDKLTLGLTIDDAVLREILGALYYPKSPYAFAVIPAEILGHVYEQFLGNVIYLTEGHRAHVEQKPEVRKAGGVYYTPTYIVDYIVSQTVGPLVEGKTPKQLEKLRVLDPACGSGSFLLGAYEYLLDWHLRYYLANDPAAWAKKKNPPIYETSPNARGIGVGSGNWQLTTHERKRILTANLYGVDIDAQAVEVTKLSLLLKVLEGEARELQGKQVDFYRVLPDLEQNIKCGNSLIGSNFYEQPALPEFDEKARYKINAFDWAIEFKSIMDAGGFDVVIGNPPYLGGREWKEDNGRQYDFFVQRFSVADYQFDIYALFFEQAVRLVRHQGFVGFITPNTWLNNLSCFKLRKFLIEQTSILAIADYSRENVFRDAIVLPIISILRKGAAPGNRVAIWLPRKNVLRPDRNVAQRLWAEDENLIFNLDLSEEEAALRDRLFRQGVPLSSLATVKFGIKIYETGKGSPPQKASAAAERIFEAKQKLDSSFRPYLEGKDVDPYLTKWQQRWLKYGPNLAAPRDPTLFEGERLVFRRIVGRRLIGTHLRGDFVTSQLLQIVKPHAGVSPKYLLGILNSTLMGFVFRKTYSRTDKTFPEIRVYELESLPIANPESPQTNPVACDQLIVSVDRMLNLRENLAGAKTPDAQVLLSRDIATIDRVIDRLVYDIYGLSPAEIMLVEQAISPAAESVEPAP
jgi:hypothetical protein